MSALENLTELLRAWQQGDAAALEKLVPIVRRKLHDLAAHYLRHQAHAQSWRTSDLVQEAWLKLLNSEHATWQDREHFYSIAARQMRHILVSHARARRAEKRGGGALKVPLEDICEMPDEHAALLLPLNDALNDLEARDPEKVRIVELRYFGGLTVEETARALDISVSTVVRQWAAARAWLQRELREGDTNHETATDQPTTMEAN